MEQLELTIPEAPDTLADARTTLYRNLQHGTVCPCCDRHAQLYKRKLNSSMAYALILIYRYFQRPGAGNQWLHVENYLKNLTGIPSSIRGDFTKLVHWDLLEAGTHAGYYRVTSWGEAFVKGEHEAAKYMHIYADKKRGTGEGHTTISEALGSRFDLKELMAGGVE